MAKLLKAVEKILPTLEAGDEVVCKTIDEARKFSKNLRANGHPAMACEQFEEGVWTPFLILSTAPPKTSRSRRESNLTAEEVQMLKDLEEDRKKRIDKDEIRQRAQDLVG
jgi:hypothetical protein